MAHVALLQVAPQVILQKNVDQNNPVRVPVPVKLIVEKPLLISVMQSAQQLAQDSIRIAGVTQLSFFNYFPNI